MNFKKNIIDELKIEKIKVRKADPEKALILESLITNAMAIAKKSNREATNEDVMLAVKKTIKSLTGTLEQINNESPLAKHYIKETELLRTFLPKQIGEEVIANAIRKYIEEIGEPLSIKLMGRIMGKAKAEFGNAADMTVVSKLTREVLK